MEENTQQQVPQHLGDLIINSGNELKEMGIALENVCVFEEGKEPNYKLISETLKQIHEMGNEKKGDLRRYLDSFWVLTLMLTTYTDILKTIQKGLNCHSQD